ncbi:hypothetical protein KZ483_26980 [Paenibacillus sp. sptzw28]|uniref:hypothetical protein n=1 Tax=Paenibacillus sp. sptzw28 TaxID=715179 RepID=UPI001C6EEFBA|nr:hypothetical protein [Paenibacillus sp. sptzw28]QYR21282.1 hypothetical protein KZ483_26980 [Paenibacillus sp. sptzw28]
MANNIWSKWLIGLSSVALFTGFVGFASKNSESLTQTEKLSSSSGTVQTSTQDELSNQWMSDNQSSSSYGGTNNDSGSDMNSDSSVNNQGSGSQGNFTGRMRTQGS